MLPNFLIIGASKCGTTALYYYLKQHPEISFPNLKEPKFFSSIDKTFPHNGTGDNSVDRYAIKSFKQYKKLFEKINNKRVGEASPDTIFYHKKTAVHIKSTLGDVPIIIILRNPIKRAFSAFMYLKRDSREKLSFNEALSAEEKRLDNNWDFIWGYKKCGLYFEQVKTFIEKFSKVKIIFQEDLKQKPEKVLKELHKFLDVEINFNTNFSIKHNESGIPNNFLSKFLLSRNNYISTTLREVMKILIPRILLEKIASKSLSKISITEKDYNSLKSFYYDDICKLEKLLNRDLSSWK